MQRIWRSKPGMDLYSVIGMCAKIEDLIYNNSLREYGVKYYPCFSYFIIDIITIMKLVIVIEIIIYYYCIIIIISFMSS